MENGVFAPEPTGKQYDVIIVGAGPAGLSAARTTARLGFSTLVLERLPEIGRTAHPCNAVLAPVPGLITGRRLLGDLFYPQLDLLIPLSLVVGYPRHHRFISPNGQQVTVPLARGDGSPVAAIDKVGLLRLIAGQAERSGAELRCGTEVTGLVTEHDRIAGVRTSFGEIRAALVLVAEGSSRRLSRLAGIFPAGRSERYATVLTRELVAPAVRRQHLGQITTFGRRYTSARAGFGSLVMPLPGRASVAFTLLSAGPHLPVGQPASFYLDEYIQRDPRIRELLAGAETEQEAACTIALDAGPAHVVRDGFLSFGDAASPAGHMGLLPAMYLGRQAALVAAEALDMDDLSARCLSRYERLYYKRVQATLQAERELMLGLVQAADDELDRLARLLSGLPLPAPFFSGWQGMPWEAARWLARHYPEGTYQTDLLHRILDGDPERVDTLIPAGLWPLPSRAGTAVS